MSICLLGDFGTSDIYQKIVANNILLHIKPKNIKFVCGLGDNIYEGGVKSIDDKKFYSHFEEPYKDINLKFYHCLGNHDYGKILFNHIIPDNYKYQIEYTNFSDKWCLPKRYYHYTKIVNGVKINFFVLDTNLDLMEDNEIMEQLKYFKDKIKKSKGDWNILYGHHTYRSVAGHGNAEPLLENFLNALLSYGKIDLYMCGHDHTKQYIQKDIENKKIHIIVCGSGGKPYNYVTNLQNMQDCKLMFSSTNLGHGILKPTKKYLYIEFFDDKNNLEYNYKIKK